MRRPRRVLDLLQQTDSQPRRPEATEGASAAAPGTDSGPAQTPSATFALLFHCLLCDDGVNQPHAYKMPKSHHAALPNMYAVCAIDERARPAMMLSGVLLKTDLDDGDPSFLSAIQAVFSTVDALQATLDGETCFQVSKVDVTLARSLRASESISIFEALRAHHRDRQCVQKGAWSKA